MNDNVIVGNLEDRPNSIIVGKKLSQEEMEQINQYREQNSNCVLEFVENLREVDLL